MILYLQYIAKFFPAGEYFHFNVDEIITQFISNTFSKFVLLTRELQQVRHRRRW